MQHAGDRNGTLICTFDDFAKNGIRRKSVSLAIRQCEALGFLERTRKGGLGKGKTHLPSNYRLTYVVGRHRGSSHGDPRTNEWTRLEDRQRGKGRPRPG